MDAFDKITAQLIAPGGGFDVVEEEVLGQRMQVFAGRKRSLREVLADSALHGDAEYIVSGDRRISYAEHYRMVCSTAAALRDQYKIKPGDRVAILAENHPEWLVTFWATVSLGAVVSALNGWWKPDEIRHALELTTPRVLVVDEKRLAGLGDALAAVPGIAVIRIETDFEQLANYAPDVGLPETPIAEDDPAVILFTSGTTGRAKGAVNTHRGVCGFLSNSMLHGFRNIMLAAEEGVSAESDPPATCALMTVPLFHMSGLYTGGLMMMAAGAKSVWRLGAFDPEEVLRLIEKERVTIWAGLGSMAPRVLGHPRLHDYDLSSLRNLGSGGAPTTPETQARMRDLVPNGEQGVGLGYGSSETAVPVTMTGGRELAHHPLSVGRVMPTQQVEIRNDGGHALPDGEDGEIFVRSPYLMLEYWGQPEATCEAIHPDRWLATGDIGHLLDGRLYINSRARDMILRAAENIYPVEIERRLEAHPAVEEAAVIGVDHAELGQEVKAVVVLASGADAPARQHPTSEELAAWCAETMAAFKVPSLWQLRSEPLPRNAAGKVLKIELES
ncbi:MAG: acyl--CoA ligase [Deltaproteobacteria bacterium]|jgi:acyl-CoA synthetase (AMP-forming)/AMP-acid ligase II|nr:acyl--CoA ligase [Deltaproteobacteria bacterium]